MLVGKSDRPMTVMQILPALEVGGVETGTVEINNALLDRGHRSLVVSSGGRLVQPIEVSGGEHIQLDTGKKSPATLLQIHKLRKILHQQRVDLVHARSRMPAWITFLAWRGMPTATRPRFVTTAHGLNSVNRYSQVMTRGERVIAVSNYCRDYVLRNYPSLDPRRLTVIHRGVDSDQYPYGYRPASQWLDDWDYQFPELRNRLVVMLPGRFTRLKGHLLFLRAIELVKSRGVPVQALLVGGEDPRRRKYAQTVREEVAHLGLTHEVTFAGYRSDIREVMSVADVVVSTSTKPESFGRTVLEAVRLGRTTLGFDHGGVGEVLGKVYPEGRIPKNDHAALAEKIIQVHQGRVDPPSATHEFELSAMLDKELDLYETLITSPRRLRRAS